MRVITSICGSSILDKTGLKVISFRWRKFRWICSFLSKRTVQALGNQWKKWLPWPIYKTRNHGTLQKKVNGDRRGEHAFGEKKSGKFYDTCWMHFSVGIKNCIRRKHNIQTCKTAHKKRGTKKTTRTERLRCWKQNTLRSSEKLMQKH